MFQEWLDEASKHYNFIVQYEEGDNYFTNKTYSFSDPKGNGLAFSVSLDDKNKPSVFNTPMFDFAYFNVAEYVSENDILMAAEACLRGEIKLKKTIFNKYRLEFDLPSFKGYSRSVKLEKNKLPSQYEVKIEAREKRCIDLKRAL